MVGELKASKGGAFGGDEEEEVVLCLPSSLDCRSWLGDGGGKPELLVWFYELERREIGTEIYLSPNGE